MSSSLFGPRLFVGVDAGGSKTLARVANHAGETLGLARGGPANANTDPCAAWKTILETCAQAIAEAGLGPEALGTMHAGLGIAGLDHLNPQMPAEWGDPPFKRWRVEGDAVVAQLGAFAGQDGAVLIVGTGTVGLSVMQGRRVVIGGYGSNVSDEGSGAWIGREAVRRALWALDGRRGHTGLVAALENHIGSLANVAAWSRIASPANYAQLVPAVLELEKQGDAAARHILADAAAHIADVARGLVRSGATKLAITGGLGSYFGPRLDDVGIEIVEPLGDALDGAIALARMAQ